MYFYRYLYILSLLLAVLMLGSCEKGEIIASDNEIVLDNIDEILLNSARACATIDYKIDKVVAYGFCWSRSPGASLNDSFVEVYYNDPFNSYIDGLEPNTTYFVRAYLSTPRKTLLSNEISISTGDGQLSDIDGNQYTWIQIGYQGWTAQNLKTTRYADGTSIYVNSEYGNRFYWYGSKHHILAVSDADIDQDGDIDSYDSLLYVNRYGLLYSWYSANNQFDLNFPQHSGRVTENVTDVCPDGWHLPDIDEWNELDQYLRYWHGSDSAAIVLKSSEYWLENNDGTDLYGFSVIPAGFWHDPDYSHWRNMGRLAKFWSATQAGGYNALSVRIDHDDNAIYESFGGKGGGYSIRCVKNR